MQSECIITSNRGQYRYKLTRTGFVEFGKNSVYQYNIDRTNIRLALSADDSADDDETSVDVWYVDDGGNKLIKSVASLSYDKSLDTDGHLRIGCRDFNKTTTRLLQKWFGL